MSGHRRLEAFLDGPGRWLLLPFWLFYRPLVWLRNRAFDRGVRRGERLSVPVICVGNLSAGGTGKTPVVAWICAELSDLGHRPAVISRGYRGDGTANDEARTMAVPVFCDPHRVAAGRRAIAAGADVLVMDDGFQHRQLQRDCDIVCVDATRPPPAWHRTQPMGLLREGPAALRRADLVLLTRSDQVAEDRSAALVAALARADRPVYRASHRPVALRRLDGSERPLAELAGSAVLLVSGIGNPAAFEATAHAVGARLVGHVVHPDHHAYSAAQLQALAERARARGVRLLTTAKDAVKWRDRAEVLEPDQVWILEVALALDEPGRAALRDRLKDLVAGRQEESGSPRTG